MERLTVKPFITIKKIPAEYLVDAVTNRHNRKAFKNKILFLFGIILD